jgi:NAD(P)-dependent dehydrogenase (short-subunit alcohol dehydrogenase family)
MWNHGSTMAGQRLTGKVALVTGASRGGGKGIALVLGEEGATVYVTGRSVRGEPTTLNRPGTIDDTADEVTERGGTGVAVRCDHTDDAQVEALFERILREHGRLDVLVNNAGFLRDRMVFSSSEDEWDAVIRVHLKGHFATTRHASEYWRAQSKAGEDVDGRIVNTSSGAGLMGSVGQGAYAAAKAGIAALTLVESAELARYGVTANAIAPSARTRMTEDVFGDRMAVPDSGFDANHPGNVSPLVVWLGSADSRDVTGRVFEVEGGILSVADGWQHGPRIDKGARWAPADVGPAVRELIAKAPPPAPVYGA